MYKIAVQANIRLGQYIEKIYNYVAYCYRQKSEVYPYMSASDSLFYYITCLALKAYSNYQMLFISFLTFLVFLEMGI